MMKRRVPAILALIPMILAACGPSSGPSTSPTSATLDGQTITQRLPGDWVKLDFTGPAINNQGAQITMALHDRLVALDARGKVIPYLAKSWEVGPSSITFRLRTDATCSDGTPVTASVVAKSLERVGKTSTQLPRLIGAGPYTVTFDESANTVTFSEPQPFNEMLLGFANAYASILCPAAFTDLKQMETKSFGSGPYTLVSAVHGDRAIVKRRDDWKWGPQGTTAKDLPSTMIYRVVENTSTAANLLVTSGLDLAMITGVDVRRLTSDKSLHHQLTYSLFATTMTINQASGHPGVDPAVRQALMMAVDAEAYNQARSAGLDKVAKSGSLFSTDMPCYDASTTDLVPKYDLEGAKSVLNKAGYTADSSGKLSKDGKPLALVVLGSTSNHGQGPAYMSEQYSKLGMAVTTRQVDDSAYTQDYIRGNYDILVHGNTLAVPAPSNLAVFYQGKPPPRGSNLSNILNPVIDDSYKVGTSASSDKEKCAGWSTFQKELLKNFNARGMTFTAFNVFSKKIRFVGAMLIEPWSLRAIA
jgi:peptide/nickel transport system substrate-binding protein